MMEQPEWDEQSPPLPRQLPTVPATTWAKQARQIVIRRWQPEPLSEPVIDDALPHLSVIERSAEVISFTGRRFEYWLSPQGTLREWFKFNLRLAIGFAVPALLVAPLITLALNQFNLWIDVISKTTSNIVLVPLSVLHEWRQPRHEVFQPRNVWSLFNAFTETLKGNLTELPKRTEALHGLFDTHVGLSA